VLKVALVLVGLLFAAAILPTIGGLQDPAHSDTGDTMQMAIYFVLGIFLLLAVRDPVKHRSLISFTAWSSLAHAFVMTTLGFELPPEKSGFIAGSAILVVIAVLLLALRPRRATSPVESPANHAWSSDTTASPLPPSA
jgi:hypothetical protein